MAFTRKLSPNKSLDFFSHSLAVSLQCIVSCLNVCACVCVYVCKCVWVAVTQWDHRVEAYTSGLGRKSVLYSCCASP